MSWWWEEIHSANLYPLYQAMNSILGPTGWGLGTWTNLQIVSAGDPPPLVGDWLPGGLPFNAHLVLDGGWGSQVTGRLALANSLSADYAGSLLNSFVHGRSHPDLRRPFLISAWLTNNARMVLHLNSVSSGSTLVVRADASELLRTNLPNLDGTYNVNQEYNIDFTVNLPAGKRSLEVTNAGSDWFFLDWVRVEGVLPATYQGNWQPTPSATGLQGERESLVYVVAPGVAFPGSATNPSPALTTNGAVTFASWPPGEYFADWYDPATGTNVASTRSITTNALFVLPLPGFREDLAGVIYPRPRLVPVGVNATSSFQFQFLSEHGGRYLLERATNLAAWTDWRNVTNTNGTMLLEDTWAQGNRAVFYRARKP